MQGCSFIENSLPYSRMLVSTIANAAWISLADQHERGWSKPPGGRIPVSETCRSFYSRSSCRFHRSCFVVFHQHFVCLIFLGSILRAMIYSSTAASGATLWINNLLGKGNILLRNFSGESDKRTCYTRRGVSIFFFVVFQPSACNCFLSFLSVDPDFS